MRSLLVTFTIILAAIMIVSCKKDSFITSADALLRTSEDTIHYDTVFTTVGSYTQFFKIFNDNDQKLKLSSVQLMGGATSQFKMNVDGVATNNATDVEIEKNDSLYVFVTVTVNPNAANLAFLIQDSIKISFNGNTRFVQLDAYGQNANFLRNQHVTQDSTWNNDLPFVILGGLTVDEGKKLTINKGTKIYCHADAPIIVNGTLTAVGEQYDSTKIVFQGDRLDEPYRDFPGAWPGIFFTAKSINNNMQFCVIKNAYQGIIVDQQPTNTADKLVLDKCILDNIYDVALGGSNTKITATNCLISNCGYNVYLTAGGTYNFNHCTVASYQNNYLSHKYPVFTVTNAIDNTTQNPDLTCSISNSIIYGEGGLAEDEINVIKRGDLPGFTVTLNNVLYKVKTNDPTNTAFNNCIKNQSPLFDTIDTGKRFYNFRLRAESPCVDAGINSTLLKDLDNNNRPLGTKPDIGCYESH